MRSFARNKTFQDSQLLFVYDNNNNKKYMSTL